MVGLHNLELLKIKSGLILISTGVFLHKPCTIPRTRVSCYLQSFIFNNITHARYKSLPVNLPIFLLHVILVYGPKMTLICRKFLENCIIFLAVPVPPEVKIHLCAEEFFEAANQFLARSTSIEGPIH